ncbi:MAG TPA: putative lipid II flippase FtsW [Planctomycetota bacterium]|nr:putative lipid II flippase FtsW [Planctomycetota bacterium]
MKSSRSWILVIAAALVGLGLVMVFSTSAVHGERFGSPTKLLLRQAVWLGMGLAAMIIAWRVDYRFWERHYRLVLGVSAGALLLVLIPGVGSCFNGARRWVRVFGYGVQPSEFAKIGLAVFVAAYLARHHDRLNNFVRGLLPVSGVVGAVALLVALEPDTGTALLIGGVAFMMLFVGGIRMRMLLPIGTAVALLFAVGVLTHLEYVQARLNAFWNPSPETLHGSGYQAWQSLIAMGSGGALGTGLGAGQIKLHFLPEAHTDFILSIIGEELGLVGTLTVIGLFIGLVYHGMKVAQTAPDRFGFLLVFGLVLFIGVQAAVNIAVVTASVPTKGISLPFVSYGGSGLLVSLFSLGMIMSVARAGDSVEAREDELAEMVVDPGEPAPNPLAQ